MNSHYLIDAMLARVWRRLEYVRLQPKRVLSWGWGAQSVLAEQLKRRFPDAEVIVVAEDAVFDPRVLPFDNESIDYVFASHCLHQYPHLPMVLAECQRVLTLGGLFMFCAPGPDTLLLQRRHFEAQGLPHAVPLFPDMHDVGDAMIEAGLSDPVMDRENLTIPFDCIDDVLEDRLALGIKNFNPDRRLGLLTSRQWQVMLAQCPLDVTWELIQGQAWKVQPKAYRQNDAGEVAVPISSIKVAS